MDIEDLFSIAVFSVYRRQMALLDWIGDRNWNYDMATSSISFTDESPFETQILGLESVHGIWMWRGQMKTICLQHLSDLPWK